jgi:hypothetical protein
MIIGISPAPLTVAWEKEFPVQYAPTGRNGPLNIGFARLAAVPLAEK